jgi:hypothetical protein
MRPSVQFPAAVKEKKNEKKEQNVKNCGTATKDVTYT